MTLIASKRYLSRHQFELLVAVCLAASALLVGACGDDAQETEPSPTNEVDAGQQDAGQELDVSHDPDTAPSKAAVGESCESPSDCVAKAHCVQSGTDDGFECMKTCTQSTTPLCDDGSLCTSAGDSSVCYSGGDKELDAPCSSNLECARGLNCIGAGSEYFCSQACTDASQCSDNQHCELLDDTGYCQDNVGQSCSADTDCADGSLVCSSTLPGGGFFDAIFPNGYCTKMECNSDAECPGDGVCTALQEDGGKLCLDTCESEADCRANYDCLSDEACDSADDPEACRQLLGEKSICIVGEM